MFWNVMKFLARFFLVYELSRNKIQSGGVIGSQLHVWTYIYIYIYIYVCVCVCVYIYIYIYIYTDVIISWNMNKTFKALCKICVWVNMCSLHSDQNALCQGCVRVCARVCVCLLNSSHTENVYIQKYFFIFRFSWFSRDCVKIIF